MSISHSKDAKLNKYISSMFIFENRDELEDAVLKTYAFNGTPIKKIIESLIGEYSMKEKIEMVNDMRK